MAEEEEEQQENTEEATEEKGGKSKVLLFSIIGVVLVVLLVGTPILIMSMGSDKNSEEMEKLEKEAAAMVETVVVEGYEEEDEYADDEEEIGAIYPLEIFVVNLSGGGYLRCLAQVEFNKRDVPRRFFTKMVPVRDKLLSLLTSKSRNDIEGEKGRGKLRDEMKDIINATLRKEEVKYVYFSQFIIQ